MPAAAAPADAAARPLALFLRANRRALLEWLGDTLLELTPADGSVVIEARATPAEGGTPQVAQYLSSPLRGLASSAFRDRH